MSGYPADQALSPPDLPPYLDSICKLSPIVGVPSDEQVIEIHTTIRVANRVADLRGMGDSALLARLSEHLFNAQMDTEANIRAHTTYTPPVLPVHIPVTLEPISGPPSQDEVIKVENAVRSYQKLTDIPSLFDPQVNAELNQHLFDIQMARYMERCTHANPVPQSAAPAEPAGSNHLGESANEETNRATNNAGRAADVVDAHQTASSPPDPIIRDAIERSNQLAERSNQLIERSNQIAEQLTRAVEQSSQPNEQSIKLTEKLTELFGQSVNQHFGQSNRLAELSTKPVEKLEEALRDISRVLATIQHAIVRNHKGNTGKAADCLTNEKGYTPGGVASNYFESKTSYKLGDAGGARVALSRYLSSCLG
ncbi:hypothetical protein RSAG8_13665, partial [Rhizoctonia solani AG-8 WAC10335]